MGLSSSGNSGKVGFPEHMETFHEAMIGSFSGSSLGTIIAAMTSGTSPYSGESAYDPDIPLAASQTRYDVYNSDLTSFTPNTDWQTAVGVVRSKLAEASSYPEIDLLDNDIAAAAITNAIAAATAVMASSGISNQVIAYENKTVPRFLRSVNRFTAGMADIGAVNSSAFVIGMALLESDVTADVNKYDADLSSAAFNVVALDGVRATFQAAVTKQQQRNIQFAEANSLLMQGLQQKIQLGADAARLQAELNRVKIVAKGEQTDRDLELDVLDSYFDLEVLSKGMGVLGGLTGASYIPDKPTKAQSAIGGAISGAAAGAAIGGVPGAVIGGIGGLLSGLL